MKYYSVESDMYPLTIHLLIGEWHEEEAKRLLDESTGEDTDVFEQENMALARFWSRGGHQVIWCHAYSLPNITHEFLHAIFASAEFLGIDYSESSEEFYCYMMSWLVDWYETKIKK